VQQGTHIRNIIFDYGGVIIDLDYGRTEEAFKKLGVKDFEHHFNQLTQTPLFDDFDKGKISETEFRHRLNQQVGAQFTDEQIDGAWNAMLLGIRSDKLKLLGEIYPDFRIYLLSNTNLIHIKYITKYLVRAYGRANLDTYFDKVYYSFTTGFRKPDREMFMKVINDNDLKPSETLYIDDSPQHIEGAKAVGLQAVLYSPTEDLRTFLMKHISIQPEVTVTAQ